MVQGPPVVAGQGQDAAVVGAATMEAPTAPEVTVSVFAVTSGSPTKRAFPALSFGVPPAVSPWFGKSCITIGKKADE